ncbi:MAG: translocation/assembly module TamB, partial [Prevotellaceae bacterium]|nr:translocation/assembly module TamB [Prevotellaceae bacterium]
NKNYFDLTFDAKKFELKIIEPLVIGELNEIEGDLTGILNLKGVGGKLNLLGDAIINEAGFTVDFLKTHYMFSAPISFSKNAIKIRDNTTLYDKQRNKGRLNAAVNHEHLKNFVFDINLNADKLLGLNTVKNDNDDFYGRAYVSGMVRMKGKLDDLNLNINVRPDKSTRIVIPLNSATISEKTLLTFVNNDSVKALDYMEAYIAKIKEKHEEVSTAKSKLNISLSLAMNNNAEVQILLDENSGDAITGTGSGTLQIGINPSEEKFQIYGNYIIENGNFKWTLPMLNLLLKEFAINRGSQIHFNGDMNKTKIDITADYVRPLRLSLRNLLADTTISNAKYPVVCKVQLTDNISNFSIKPIIEVQNIDVDTKARVQAMLNTDEKLWKQFSFLLAFGNFIPEEQMGNIISNASITSNISEILSNQLSAWLATLKVPVDLGVDIRTGSASTETEFDAHASFKMFEDRVEVSGNIGSAPRTSTSDVAGNFDVDIKLNPSGSLKFKAFSHSTNEYTDDTETSRQGGRISYQGGFNTWKELWNSIFHPNRLRQRRERYRQRQANIQDSINAIPQDTAKFEIKSDTTGLIH